MEHHAPAGYDRDNDASRSVEEIMMIDHADIVVPTDLTNRFSLGNEYVRDFPEHDMETVDPSSVGDLQGKRSITHREPAVNLQVLLHGRRLARIDTRYSDKIHFRVKLKELKLLGQIRPPGKQFVIVHPEQERSFNLGQCQVKPLAEAGIEWHVDDRHIIPGDLKWLLAIVSDHNPSSGEEATDALHKGDRLLLPLEGLEHESDFLSDKSHLLRGRLTMASQSPPAVKEPVLRRGEKLLDRITAPREVLLQEGK